MTFTFDTGMLIALERRKQRATEACRNIVRRAAVVVEDMPPSLCRAAGEALGAVKGSTIADAIDMASAALQGGGIVYTSDVDDLKQLQRHFPTVLLLPV